MADEKRVPLLLTMAEVQAVYEAIEAWLVLPKEQQPDFCDQHLANAQQMLGTYYYQGA